MAASLRHARQKQLALSFSLVLLFCIIIASVRHTSRNIFYFHRPVAFVDAHSPLSTKPCPVHSRDLEVYKRPIDGRRQLCAESSNGAGGTRCSSPYGTLQPTWMLDWGKVSVDWETKTFRHLFRPERQFSLLRDFHKYEHDEPCPQRSDVDLDYYQRAALTLATLEAARESFVMFELGGGTCRWIIDAFLFIGMNRPYIPVTASCVEADPLTVEYARATLELNGLSHSTAYLYHGAVSTKDAETQLSRKNNAISYGGFDGRSVNDTASKVSTFSLETLLSQFWMVDHVDIDCNGCEEQLFGDERTLQVVTDRVKSIFVETHTAQKHEVVKNGLDSKGWLKDCLFYLDFPEQDPVSGEISPVDKGQGEFIPELAGYFWCLNPRYHLM